MEDDTKQDTRRLFWKQNQKVGDISQAKPEEEIRGKKDMSKVDWILKADVGCKEFNSQQNVFKSTHLHIT